MSTAGSPDYAPGSHAGEHAHPHGWRRWLFATNHKDIGTLYLWFSVVMFLAGGVLALLIRLELFQPGLQFFQPELYNQFVTLHGLVMIFGAIMPAFVGFANGRSGCLGSWELEIPWKLEIGSWNVAPPSPTDSPFSSLP